MASEKKIAANRKNALNSTGPLSRKGKARAKLNALKHGLATSLFHSPLMSDNITSLAVAIAGPAASDQERSLSLAIAEATWELERAKQLRTDLYGKVLGNVSTAVSSNDLCDLLGRIRRIDRYGRRALSRRKRSIRGLDQLKLP